MSDCSTILPDLVAYLDGELLDRERSAVASHLEACQACRRELDRLARVGSVLDRVPARDAPPGFEERVRARIAAEMASERSRRSAARRLRRFAIAAAIIVCVTAVSVGIAGRRSAPPFEDDPAGPPAELIAHLETLENLELLENLDALETAAIDVPEDPTQGLEEEHG